MTKTVLFGFWCFWGDRRTSGGALATYSSFYWSGPDWSYQHHWDAGRGSRFKHRLPVRIARYIGLWAGCLYQHFLAWSCGGMPLGPPSKKKLKCCAAVWDEHGLLTVAFREETPPCTVPSDVCCFWESFHPVTKAREMRRALKSQTVKHGQNQEQK